MADFLRTVFAGQDVGSVVIFKKPSNQSLFSPVNGDDWAIEAAKSAVRWRESENVYFAIGVQGQKPLKGRGKQDGVIALPGLWADVDILGPNHFATNLPPTLADAWKIIDAFPLKPTLMVYTGGGVQPLWLFREPMEAATDKERRAAQRLSKSFQAYLGRAAAGCGWTMDNTADLCRLLRLPGTYNRKQETPVLVTYEVVGEGQRYNPSEFAEFLELEADPILKAHVQGAAPATPTADFRLVLAGCPWMRHCKDDASTLTEPEWYRMLSVVSRCTNSGRIAQEMSHPHPKYTADETEEKLRQARDATGPVTCDFVGTDLSQGHHCGRCNHLGKIKSPVVLGIARRTKQKTGNDGATNLDTGIGHRLPNIQATGRQLRQVSLDALKALIINNNPPTLFVRSGKAVCVTAEESGRRVIADVSDSILRNRLTRSADFYDVTALGIRNCVPPMDVVKDILATPAIEWSFPPLVGIIESPSLREDGTLITLPGYDAASRLYYAPDPELIFPGLPERPTADHLAVARATVMDIIADFPFIDDASTANAVAAMMTLVCRPAIKGPTPLGALDATTQGTGKTLLTEVISIIGAGREAALFSAPTEDEEWRKQLTSILREGSATVIIDNVKHPLDSAELCKTLTETFHGDRILGHSQTVNLPVRCTWLANGNNLRVGGDMARRCYWVRMDARCSRPFERTGFRHKRLKQYVLAHRGELLGALLTMARAWFIAGCPEPDVTPVGSYEDWTMIIGGILQFAGIKGFLGNSSQMYEQADTESSQWEGLLRTLETSFYGEPFTVAQVWERMNDKTYDEKIRQSTLTERAADLRAALPDFMAEAIDREGFFKQRLGRSLSERVGRRFGNDQVRITRDTNDLHAKVARWKVMAGADSQSAPLICGDTESCPRTP